MGPSSLPSLRCDSDFYSSLLQTSLRTNYPLVGRLVHARTIKLGLVTGVFLMNSLVNFYSKNGLLSEAHDVFDEMRERNTLTWNTVISAYMKQGMMDVACSIFEKVPAPDSVSWTIMIVGYNKIGCFAEAIHMFSDMFSRGFPPTPLTLNSILVSCAATRALDIGRLVHSLVVKLALSSYAIIANSLLNMYVKAGDLLTAEVVFSRMRMKSITSWNCMISMHMNQGQAYIALHLFEQMTERDVITWNAMISGYSQHGFDIEALDICSKMLKNTFLKPDKFTLASILSACANLKKLNIGKQIHSYVTRTDFLAYEPVRNALISMYARSGDVDTARIVLGDSSLNVIAFTALLDGYVKLGDLGRARKIFDSFYGRDVVAWTAMIVGYVQNGFHCDAMELFRRMVEDGPKPNSYTIAAMLSLSSSLALLMHGKQIHAAALRSGEASSVSVKNSLITMYAKSGSISWARMVFQMVPCEDTVSWTSMIVALAQHGFGEEAIDLFEKMLSANIKPDHITYVGVLSACVHVGLVDRGRKYYNIMQNMHGIRPTQSHCACMIDLLGRAGLLQDAWDFIKNMPVEPDVVAWGSLLASCRVYKNIDLARIATERLLLLEPDHGGAYSALANIYSACGKWEDATEIRKKMKANLVKKEQGFSWIQLKKGIHVFGVDDGLHPHRKEIFAAVAEVWKDIKEMGFVPDIASVLWDLDDEVKEQMLMHHSEKLAIVYGLMNTLDNTTLRIMKNLRVCNDCHVAIKYISKLSEREIVVRDATRFHHFKDGSCSCRDYW